MLDEFARHTGALSCPAGRPLIYRTYGVTATPSSMVEALDRGRTVGRKNFARQLVCPLGVFPSAGSPLRTYCSTSMDALDFIGRFVVADPLLAQRASLATSVAARMPPGVEIFNVAVTSVSLAVLLGEQAHDTYRMSAAALAARFMSSVAPMGPPADPAAPDYPTANALLVEPAKAECVAAATRRLAAVVTECTTVAARVAAAVANGDHPVQVDLARRNLAASEARRAALQATISAMAPGVVVSCGPHGDGGDYATGNALRRLSLLTAPGVDRVSCAGCSRPLRLQTTARVASCCSGTLCEACAVGPCAFCGPAVGGVGLSEAELSAVPAGGGASWLRDAIRGVQDSDTLSFRGAMARCSQAAGKSGGSCFLVFCRLFEEEGSISKEASIARVLDIVREAAGAGAWVSTLCIPEGVRAGTKRDRGARAGVVESFRNGAGKKFLVLHDAKGDAEEITGLDMPFVDFIISMGPMTNPQQAYSRCLRTSATPRTTAVPIIRIASEPRK